jgi:hypothetical protein
MSEAGENPFHHDGPKFKHWLQVGIESKFLVSVCLMHDELYTEGDYETIYEADYDDPCIFRMVVRPNGWKN